MTEADPGLVEAYERAREARPELDVPRDAFLSHLSSKVRGASAAEGVAGLDVPDLYLAFACARADPRALGAFEDDIVAHVPSFVRRLRLSPSGVDEVKQLLRAKLLLPAADGSPARILGYSGRGRLVNWARVVAVRAALDLQEQGGVAGRNPEDDADLVNPATDLEVQLLRERYGQAFEQAIREAAAGLSPRQRALLRMQHIDGLNGEQIGAVYGVNRSTVSRWLGTAHEALLEGVRHRLMQRSGLTPSEFASLARLVLSDLDVSARGILARD